MISVHGESLVELLLAQKRLETFDKYLTESIKDCREMEKKSRIESRKASSMNVSKLTAEDTTNSRKAKSDEIFEALMR